MHKQKAIRDYFVFSRHRFFLKPFYNFSTQEIIYFASIVSNNVLLFIATATVPDTLLNNTITGSACVVLKKQYVCRFCGLVVAEDLDVRILPPIWITELSIRQLQQYIELTLL